TPKAFDVLDAIRSDDSGPPWVGLPLPVQVRSVQRHAGTASPDSGPVSWPHIDLPCPSRASMGGVSPVTNLPGTIARVTSDAFWISRGRSRPRFFSVEARVRVRRGLVPRRWHSQTSDCRQVRPTLLPGPRWSRRGADSRGIARSSSCKDTDAEQAVRSLT